MKLLPLCAAALTMAFSAAHAETLVDDHFTSDKAAGRRLARGPWKVAEGVASCTQDDELFKTSKDHGPIAFFDATFTDGTVKFSYRADQVRNLVFTLNNEKGHVFRVVQHANGLSVRGWPTPGHEEQAVSLLKPEVKTPPLPERQWATAEMKIEGNRCTLTFGDFHQVIESPALAQPKSVMSIGFAYGTLAIRDVTITKP